MGGVELGVVAAMGWGGKAGRRVLAVKKEAPGGVATEVRKAEAEATGSTFTEEAETEEDDDDWEGWGFREKDK